MDVLKKTVSTVDYQKFRPFSDFNKIPDDVHVSTVTVTCQFDTEFLVGNIGKYVELNYDGITLAKYGSSETGVRTLYKSKKRTKKTKKAKKMFFNQTTVEVRPSKNSRISLKLFKNGSVQMTGVKGMDTCVKALSILCREMKQKAYIVEVNNNERKIVEKPFATKLENLEVNKVRNVQIQMINSNTHVGFEIDRDQLYKLLTKKGINCRYEPCTHAAVNIKYNYKNSDTISVFVFKPGSVIITGAHCVDHIIKAYEFITKILFEFHTDIVMNNNIMQDLDIAKFLEENLVI